MDKKTFDDVPMILNSISWQLKRIADAMEHQPDHVPVQPITSDKLERLLKSLRDPQ